MIVNEDWVKNQIRFVDNDNLSFPVQSKDLAEKKCGKIKSF